MYYNIEAFYQARRGKAGRGLARHCKVNVKENFMSKEKRLSTESHVPYKPPQPAFALCPRCHAIILPQEDGSYLTPALGLLHVCKSEECPPDLLSAEETFE